MEVEMETSPSYFDPRDHSTREKFRRYGKRYSNSSISPQQESHISKFNEAKLLYEGQIIHSPTNAALLLENIKQEAESFDTDNFDETPARAWSISKRRPSNDGPRIAEVDNDVGSIRRLGSHALKACKIEEYLLADDGDTTFALFASLLDSALQGLIPIPDLILKFEGSCRSVSESIRNESNICHRVMEDKLMRQKAQLLLDEAATWSLLWYLYGKVTDEPPEELILSPSTSHIESCQFVANDHSAQLCLRIVQWLEELASKSLDLESKVRGSHVGTYLPNSGIWYHTQRFLKKGASAANTVHHLDFDAPTREHAHQLPDDKKQDESLLEDVWTLLRAGRLEEACELCRSAGQPWRSATICPFGGLDLFPSIEALVKNGKNRSLQAIELESGIGHQWRLWKWASYCASERIFEQNGGKYEIAVYAAQCSNLKRMLPICTDWETSVMVTLHFCSSTTVNIQAKHIRIVGSDRYDHKYSPKLPSRASMSNTHQVPNPILLQPPVNQSVAAIVFGDGSESRLYPLTKRRSEGAIPIASNYRLIDAVVSNCINSNINKIYALTQLNSTSLNSHLSRAYAGAGLGKEGFIEVIAAHQSPEDQDWFQGTADAIRKCLWVLEEYPVEEFLVLPGHHLYKMDYQKLIESHRKRKSDVTIVASNGITVRDEDTGFGVLKINTENQVIQYSLKSDREPQNYKVAESLISHNCVPSMGIYLINRSTLVNLLNKHFPKAKYFGTEVIQGALSLGMKVEAYLFEGYWEDMRSIEAFYQANMECIKKSNMGYNFCDRDSPVYTMPRYLPPTIVSDAVITDSVIGDGCILNRCKIKGTVMGMRTKVGDGTIIEDSVIMGSDVYQIEDVRSSQTYSTSVPIGIGENTEIIKAIVDKNARIGKNVKIINKDHVEECERESDGYIISGRIIVVLRSAEIPDDTIL